MVRCCCNLTSRFYAGATTKPARGKCTQTSPISRSLRRITISWTSEATNSPTTGSRPVSSGVTGNGLARFSTIGILGIDGRGGDRCGIPCDIKRLSRAHLASAAMADSRNALSPGLEPRKAVERRRRRPEILPQVPGRMIGGEIGEASGGALQEWAPVSQRLIQPREMCAQLIEMVGHRRHHYDGIDISAGELDPVFEKPLRQHLWPLGEDDADGAEGNGLLRPRAQR